MCRALNSTISQPRSQGDQRAHEWKAVGASAGPTIEIHVINSRTLHQSEETPPQRTRSRHCPKQVAVVVRILPVLRKPLTPSQNVLQATWSIDTLYFALNSHLKLCVVLCPPDLTYHNIDCSRKCYIRVNTHQTPRHRETPSARICRMLSSLQPSKSYLSSSESLHNPAFLLLRGV